MKIDRLLDNKDVKLNDDQQEMIDQRAKLSVKILKLSKVLKKTDKEESCVFGCGHYDDQ